MVRIRRVQINRFVIAKYWRVPMSIGHAKTGVTCNVSNKCKSDKSALGAGLL